MKRDLVWITILCLLAFAYCLFTKTDWIEATILISGVLCVALIAIGRKEGYIFGLYTSISYAWVAFENGLFGEMLLNLLFFIPTGVWGYFLWKNKSEGNIVLMRNLSTKQILSVIATCISLTVILGFILSLVENQNSPYVDATTNILSICATILMMWRYAEQWLLYIVLNLFTVSLWIIRYQSDGYAADTMIFMWILYLLNSIYGYWRWNQKSKIQTSLS